MAETIIPASDIYVLGLCDDTRALLDHLRVEAPWMLDRVRILEGRDVADLESLVRSGIPAARMVVSLDPVSFGWSPASLDRALRSLSPGALILVGAGRQAPRPNGARATATRRRLASWRVGVLVALAVLDGLIFFVPVGSAALVAGALFAPRWLKRAARFLEAIAEGR